MEPEATAPPPSEVPPPVQPIGTSPTPVGGILSLVGGAILVAGSFLDWAAVSGAGTSVVATGIEGNDGWITVAAGVLALAAGAAILRRSGGRAAAVLAIVAGLIGGVVGLYDAVTVKDSFLDSAAEELAREFGGSVEQLRALLDAAIEVGELAVDIAVGLYLVIAGAVLALVGGAISLGRRSTAPALPPTEPEASTSATAPASAGPGDPAPPAGPPPEPPPPPPSPWAVPERVQRDDAGSDEGER